MIVVFLGPPGAGKGTQCKSAVDRYGLRHLSSGDILRRERQEKSDLGKKAQTYMDAGQLVPDDLIVAMMMKEFENHSDAGFILDGFPRTIGQAQALDQALKKNNNSIDAVLNLQVDDDKLEQRVTGRRSCPECGTAYHLLYNPPQKQNLCDNSCGELDQRPDDTAEVVRNRIDAYHKQTAPLVDYYQKQGNVRLLDGNLTIEQVTLKLFDIMDSLLP